MIYVVSIPGYAKIGHTDDADRRLGEYRSHNPLVTRFDGVWRGNLRRERALLALARETWTEVPGTDWLKVDAGTAVAFVAAHIADEIGPEPIVRPVVDGAFTGAELVRSELQRRGMRAAGLARTIGISKASISDLLSGKKSAGLQTALSIEEWSEGRVPRTAWLVKMPRTSPAPAEPAP